MPDLVVYSHRERPDLAERAGEVGDEVWPEYNRHGDVVSRSWGRMLRAFPALQFVLYDEGAREIAAEGHTLAISWDGTVDGLPAGVDGTFERAFSGEQKTALCAMAAEIRPAYQGAGLAIRMLEVMLELARREGHASLLAPVRPSWKERYPLTPIEEYVDWRRQDGEVFDPWLRVHVRAGGEILRTEPRSLRISGRVAEWESWTGMMFPASGGFVFPHGLAQLAVDRDADLGLYYEPNVWVHHRL